MLRGPKFHHKDLAKEATAVAVGRFRNAAYLAQEGRCVEALVEYGVAATATGKQTAHAREVWSGATMSPTVIRNAGLKARRELVRFCFKLDAKY